MLPFPSDVTLYAVPLTVIVYEPPLEALAAAGASFLANAVAASTGPLALSAKNFGATLGNIAYVRTSSSEPSPPAFLDSSTILSHSGAISSAGRQVITFSILFCLRAIATSSGFASVGSLPNLPVIKLRKS